MLLYYSPGMHAAYHPLLKIWSQEILGAVFIHKGNYKGDRETRNKLTIPHWFHQQIKKKTSVFVLPFLHTPFWVCLEQNSHIPPYLLGTQPRKFLNAIKSTAPHQIKHVQMPSHWRRLFQWQHLISWQTPLADGCMFPSSTALTFDALCVLWKEVSSYLLKTLL